MIDDFEKLVSAFYPKAPDDEHSRERVPGGWRRRLPADAAKRRVRAQKRGTWSEINPYKDQNQ